MNKAARLTLDIKSTFMLLLLAAVWGGSFFFGEVALSEVPPLTITMHRVVWAVPILAVIVVLNGIAIPKSPSVWGAYLVMGALNNAIPFSLIFWGQTQIASGLASILNATTAMFAAVVAGCLFIDEPLTARKIIGAALGIAGVAFIMGPSALTDFNPGNLAQLAILGATLSYAFAGVWGKIALAGQTPLMNALGMLLGSTLLMIPIVLVFDGPPNLELSASVWALCWAWRLCRRHWHMFCTLPFLFVLEQLIYCWSPYLFHLSRSDWVFCFWEKKWGLRHGLGLPLSHWGLQ